MVHLHLSLFLYLKSVKWYIAENNLPNSYDNIFHIKITPIAKIFSVLVLELQGAGMETIKYHYIHVVLHKAFG